MPEQGARALVRCNGSRVSVWAVALRVKDGGTGGAAGSPLVRHCGGTRTVPPCRDKHCHSGTSDDAPRAPVVGGDARTPRPPAARSPVPCDAATGGARKRTRRADRSVYVSLLAIAFEW